MEGREEKYVPEMTGMSMEEQAGVAMAVTKLAERRFTKFVKEIEVKKNRGYYDEEDFKKIKDLRRETE